MRDYCGKFSALLRSITLKPRISDAVIRKLTQELRPQHRKITGLLIRSELRRRYGHPGGVSRIYRILKEEQSSKTTHPSEPIPSSSALHELQATITQLRKELTETTARAERAEHREQVHQDKWALEIHELREEVRRLGGDPKGRRG